MADPLREYVERLGRGGMDELLAMADDIDAEHERRMEQCGRETRRAFARYLRSVITDYLRGKKRARVTKCVGIWNASRGYTCSNCGDALHGYQRHCGGCGAMVRYQGNGNVANFD